MVNEVKDQIITQQPFVAPNRRMQKMQTYLYDVHYVAEGAVRVVWQTTTDEDLGEHLDIFRRAFAVGGRRDVFLGLEGVQRCR